MVKVASPFRILDACFNRARESLRVLEDLARFHHGDRDLAKELKAARHGLDRHARPWRREFLQARDAASDVGRDGDLKVTKARALHEVAAANLKRADTGTYFAGGVLIGSTLVP